MNYANLVCFIFVYFCKKENHVQEKERKLHCKCS